jgi:DNA-binding response OmpR family regulator
MPALLEDIPNAERPPPTLPRVLLVDDNPAVLITLAQVLKKNGFEVVSAANVTDALKLITSQTFDVLLSDLHMPHPGDGLTVVSAMRNADPKVVTLIFSGYPEMREAAEALLLQTDEVLLKPLAVEKLIDSIKDRLKRGPNSSRPAIEGLDQILEQSAQATIEDWMERVALDPHLVAIALDRETRSAHLPNLFRDLVFRLRKPLPLGTRALVSPTAAAHGLLRRRQGYTAAMLVEESRMVQVSIFQTLQDNLHKIDFSLLLVGVMAIADEVDSQLAQQMASYISESKIDDLPVVA